MNESDVPRGISRHASERSAHVEDEDEFVLYDQSGRSKELLILEDVLMSRETVCDEERHPEKLVEEAFHIHRTLAESLMLGLARPDHKVTGLSERIRTESGTVKDHIAGIKVGSY